MQAFYDGDMSSLHEQLAALRGDTAKPATATLEDEVRALVATVLKIPVTKLTDAPHLESLDRIELAVRIEDTFGLPTEQLTWEDSLTMDDLVAAIAAHRQGEKPEEI